MLTFVFLFTLLQGVPVAADQSGTIAGVLKDSSGKPAPGVRVGAIPVPDSAADIANVSAMVSLAATDEAGKYRLENIPPGRYYVAAGRVDFPTYYPGTQALARGTVVSITPKATVEGIDFAMQDSSARVAGPELPGALGLSFSLPVQVKVEGDAKLPVFSPNGFVVIRLTNTSNGVRTEIPINAATSVVPSQNAEFRVSIENLPAGYGVKSIMAGTTDVRTNPLRLSMLNFGPSPAQPSIMAATSSLAVTLTAPAQAARPASGVRVAGRAPDGKRQAIYLSGKPGMFYSDGSFEFRGVTAGRYTLATLEHPESLRPLGASIVVGDRDLDGVQLNEVAILPQETQAAGPSNSSRTAGSVRLAALRISVTDEENHEAAGPGTIYVLGPFGTSFDIPDDGRFEFPRLLPGSYSFEFRIFRHATMTRTVVVGDEDIDLILETAAEKF